MKVLHILGQLNPSGAETMLYAAGPLLKDFGITSEILSNGPTVGPYAKQLSSVGYAIHHIAFKKNPLFFWEVFKLLKSNDYDVVHLHTEGANFWMGMVILLTGKRYLRTIHSNFPFTGFLGWRRKWQRQLLSRLGVIHISISQSVHDTEYKHYRLQTQTIPNWYDSLRFTRTTLPQKVSARQLLNISENSFVLVTVGNCSPIKNHPALIEALAKLEQTNIVYLHIGIEKDNSERILAERLGIKNLIRFEGMQSDISLYLQAADLFIMPSTYEGFGIAALEAIATGLPTLLTKVSGLSDLANSFDGLYYCEPTAQSIFEALKTIASIPIHNLNAQTVNNPEAAERLFGINRGLDAYVTCYKKLIN